MKRLAFILSTLFIANVALLDVKKLHSLCHDKKIILKTAALIAGGYFAYTYGKKTYSFIKLNLDQKIEEETIRLIELQFKLNPQCNDKELKDKAWSINIRKCVIEKLDQIDSQDPRWSHKFEEEFKTYKKQFDKLDKFRTKVYSAVHLLANDYEQEYNKPYEKISYLDQYLINTIVNNTLLKYKPDQECTAQEIIKKQNMKVSSERIAKVIQNDLGKLVLKKTLSSLASAFFTFII